jgi:hypothetical protein
MGTGYVMPKTPKTYKHFMKRAVEEGIDLLDAAGVPFDLSNIKEKLDETKTPKSNEEKLLGAVELYTKLRDKCADRHPCTIDADNVLLNYLRARGYDISVSAAAAA